MLSCKSVIVLAGVVSPALLGAVLRVVGWLMLCCGLVVLPVLRALMPMSVSVLAFSGRQRCAGSTCASAVGCYA